MLRPLRRRGKAARHALRAIDLLQGVSQEQAAFVLQTASTTSTSRARAAGATTCSATCSLTRGGSTCVGSSRWTCSRRSTPPASQNSRMGPTSSTRPAAQSSTSTRFTPPCNRAKSVCAGLDVVDPESLTHDGIRHHPNTILTPHAAFYSVEGFQEMCENGALEAKRISRAKPCGIPSIRICLSTHAAKSRRRGRVQRLAQPFAGHSCFGAGSVGGELNPWTKTKFFLINFCNFPFRFWSNFAQ